MQFLHSMAATLAASTDYYLAVAFFLGVVASYAFHRLTYVSLGGLISVGYLAGALVHPLDVLATLTLSLLSYLLVNFVFLRVFVLNNRRTFELGVLTGIVLGLAFQLGVNYFLLGRGMDWAVMAIIGFMVPGLIAHEFKRQGVMRTLVPLVAVVLGVGSLAALIVLAAAAFVPQEIREMDLIAADADFDFTRMVVAMFVSVVVAALLSDYLGWRSGGYVTAGVLVLTVSGWEAGIVLAIGVAATFGAVKLACHLLPVFGKQRLTIAILVSAIVTLAAQLVLRMETGHVVFTGFVVVALVTPALIANDIFRVGVLRTGAGMATTGAAVVGALALAG